MNELMIKLIHEKIDKELEKIPYEYGYQDIELELIIKISEDTRIGTTDLDVKIKGVKK